MQDVTKETMLQRLRDAESLLSYAADDASHYCEEDDCCVATPKCRDMHLRAGLNMLRDALEPKHVSLQPARHANTAERLYAETWVRANERRDGINHGYTLLEWILCPQGKKWPDAYVSHRDAEVAASVIQWLGTPCGHAFVNDVERRITEAAAERRAWSEWIAWNREPPSDDLKTAELLAERVKGTTRPDVHTYLVQEIAAALAWTRKDAVRSALAKLAD